MTLSSSWPRTLGLHPNNGSSNLSGVAIYIKIYYNTNKIKTSENEMAKDNLLLVIATDNKDSILKFPLLYGGVSIPRGYWKRVCVIFWGASILTVKKEESIRIKVQEMQKSGVEFSSCVVCANEYDALKSLESIGIVCNHTGELLTAALQNSEDWAVLTI